MSELTRREVVQRGLAGGAVLLGGPGIGDAAAAAKRMPKLARGGKFSLGVAAGRPFEDGCVLWTRLGEVERTSRVELEIATDAGFSKVIHRERPLAHRIRDFTVKRTVRAKRFKPGETYYYRWATRTAESPVGRFRTALPADSREPVRIGFYSCQKYHKGYYTAHRGLAAEDDLDLVICLGDYIYEEPSEPVVPERKDSTGHDGDVQSLAEYRAKYQLYKSDPDLRAMHEQHPTLAIWDDHEAEDGYAGEHEGDPQQPRRVPFLERRRAGYLSFFEYQPVLRRRDDPFRIYDEMRLGQADLFFLDTRQYRDALACPPIQPCPQGAAAGRTILGAKQFDWLQGGLAGSKATWKVIANQVMMMALDVPAGSPINSDQWDGYADERTRLIGGIVGAGVKDVTVLTGDIHTFFAGTVTDSGRTGGRAGATEFVGGSITSTGIGETLAQMGVPGTPEQQAGALKLNNPHIAYAELRSRGYGVMEIRPDELLVTYRSPSTVLEPKAEMRDLAKFRVARGSTQVELV